MRRDDTSLICLQFAFDCQLCESVLAVFTFAGHTARCPADPRDHAVLRAVVRGRARRHARRRHGSCGARSTRSRRGSTSRGSASRPCRSSARDATEERALKKYGRFDFEVRFPNGARPILALHYNGFNNWDKSTRRTTPARAHRSSRAPTCSRRSLSSRAGLADAVHRQGHDLRHRDQGRRAHLLRGALLAARDSPARVRARASSL